ncbi:class I SAM-dependent methyltransferase [Komagataeibacter sp. AV436]|uniref:Class I SAM-dependent methyltransferase n=1 Tax=Komagataeibacter melomenusus TaxID=2766578 RepID=A0ABX2AF90_9PROT|nr:class I SAM-dependent methyltransferase [Komagataeibacter melomenusus]MBV1831305.1 class I SAM-dependent methyltransferase [Komagataeibacter melomenusus]NPC67046.1 class I SAM-dependent methyltransferase [Komagataeibacter melomenusus]
MEINAFQATDLQKILASHLPMYKSKMPHYQTMMLNSLRTLWTGHPKRLIDVGGGTGVIAQAISQLFPVNEVQTIDVVDRFCKSLTVATDSYDGRTIPFETGSFDAATLNNVLHHVPVEERVNLFREIRRVVHGPLYIKDHVSTGLIDDVRLTALDAIGNIPFGGMIKAKYLSQQEWQSLADNTGWTISAQISNIPYRSGLFAVLFPNRLETTMRFDPS